VKQHYTVVQSGDRDIAFGHDGSAEDTRWPKIIDFQRAAAPVLANLGRLHLQPRPAVRARLAAVARDLSGSLAEVKNGFHCAWSLSSVATLVLAVGLPGEQPGGTALSVVFDADLLSEPSFELQEIHDQLARRGLPERICDVAALMPR
jgi:hypothetical protein